MRPIQPLNNKGSITLRFTLAGQRYCFNPVPGASYGNRRDLATVQAIATRITNDILAGNFDQTLDRYRIVPKATALTPDKPRTALELWDAWVDTLDLPDHTLADHYRMIRKMILKAEPRIDETVWLTGAKLAASTINKRLGYVRACYTWAVQEGHTESNPWLKVKPKRASKPEIKPFSRDEIKRIIQGFQDRSPHYVPFVSFLLLTGCRLSEAIGLQWSDVEPGTVAIRNSLSIDRTGNGYTRVMKPTKTGSVRILPLPTPLKTALDALPRTDGLVFRTVTGRPIDGGNFREDHWKPVLEAVGVPYRKIHTARHSVLSHAIDQGIPVTSVAYLAGHCDTRMVMQTYGHMIERPKLPELV